ncbi:hypothetical protein ACFXJO_02055 [Streptomyces lavendulae]|uniref:hypothetical protein n=1 Tax=Streptomyces lavendulae TaxID=1914 RepID=UPI0036B4F00E
MTVIHASITRTGSVLAPCSARQGTARRGTATAVRQAAFGAVLATAGTALYLHPGPGLPLLALGAFALAATVAVWLSARQR